MLFHQLRCFICVADNMSFTKAAERMNLSQSAVSQQIQNLEKELDTVLVERSSRRLKLTAAGEYLRDEGRILLKRVDEVEERVKDLGANSDFIFRFGYLNTFTGHVIGKALEAFHEMYPELKISVVSGTHEELYNALNRHDVDIILSDQRRAFSPDYGNMIVGEAQCFAELLSSSHFAEADELDISSLENIPCIIPAAGDDGECRWISEILGVRSLISTATDISECRLMASAGQGFVLSESFDVSSDDSNLKRIRLVKDNHPLSMLMCLFYRLDKENYYIEEFPKVFRLIKKTDKQSL